jgi:hypothetical protein
MRHRILHANPIPIAIVGSVPFLIAGLALVAGLPLPTLAQALASAAFLGVAFVLGWCWAVGSALNESIAMARRPSNAAFRAALTYSAAYAVAGFARFVPPFGNPALAVGLQLLAWAAMAQVLYFVAKNLSLAERDISGRSAPVWRTTLVLFSIAGIPAVQRRVNHIFDRA